MEDLRKYVRALYQGVLLSPETQSKRLEFMPFEDSPDFVGYGEGILKFGNFYGHNGTIFGFSTDMYYLPEKDAVLIINVNRLDLDDYSHSYNLFIEISRLLFLSYVLW
jgi:D-alanyl-D-alanine carboxypeptidase